MPDLSGFTASPNTGASLSAQAEEAVRQLWQKNVDVFEQNNDFFKQFEGPSMDYPIQVKTDTSKGKGQKITFPVMAGFHNQPHIGDELFENGEHFEEAVLGSNSLTVDWFRHATRYNERGEELMGMRGELNSEYPQRLGEWMGRLKTEHLLMMFKLKGDAPYNYRFANDRASANDLQAGDTFDYANVVERCAQLKRGNGKAARVGVDMNGNPIHKMISVATSDAISNLKLDPTYQNAMEQAGPRGEANYIFAGGVYPVDGNIIKEYTVIDHDGAGPIGSPMSPQASLGAAIASGTATFDIKGGGSAARADLARVQYFKWFPNASFKFSPTDIVAAASNTFYVVILNETGADAGKFGFYECVGNSGQALTVTKRLAAADGAGGADIRYNTVGNVTWDAAKNTVAHPEGSLILLASKYGEHIGGSIYMGNCCARRGIGMYTNKRGSKTHEDDFVTDLFIKSVFGQAPRRDVLNRAMGFIWHAHTIDIPGINYTPTLA